MRCKYCGSKAIYPHTNHEHSSAKKVVVNTLIWGAIGTAASLAGKNVNGYRCSTCGSFCEQTMSYMEESAIDSAIREAKEKGASLSYERYAEKYRGIEQIMLYARPVAQAADNGFPQEKAEESVISEQALQIIQQKQSVKHSYNPGKYIKTSPVLIESVTIETDNGADVLRMLIRNVSDKVLRSVYFKACIYDDVGDQISECSCVYQGLSVGAGEYLPADKTFDLKTDVAYKVGVVCEKAAFTDDSIWRQAETPVEYTLPESTELTLQSFPQYKYLVELFRQKCKPGFEGKLYMPAFEEGFRLCVCGSVVDSGDVCRLCGLDENALREIIDFDNLVECRCAMIKSVATKRTAAIQKMYAQAQEIKYQEALQLQQKATQSYFLAAAEMFATLSGYKDAQKQAEACKVQAENIRQKGIYDEAKALMVRRPQTEENYQKAIKKFQSVPAWEDANEQIAICQQKIEEFQAKAEAERLARERNAELARQEAIRAERRRKIRKTILSISVVILLLLGVFIYFLYTEILPGNQYNTGLNLLAEGKFDEAYAVFESLGDYSNSAEQCKEVRYQQALSYWGKKEYETSNPIFKELGTYKDSAQKIHTHAYAHEVITAPGCETRGEAKLTCKSCPHFYTQPINSTGHTYGEMQTSKAPTCTETGEQQAVCSACGNTVIETVPMIAHSYSGNTTTAATCETAGVKTFTCSCGNSYTEAIKAKGHSYNAGVITTAATCEKDGIKTFTCKCGKSYTETVKATGHSYAEATCTTASICTNCKLTIQAALGHVNVNQRCTRCEANLTEKATIVIDGMDSYAPREIGYTYASGYYQITITILESSPSSTFRSAKIYYKHKGSPVLGTVINVGSMGSFTVGNSFTKTVYLSGSPDSKYEWGELCVDIFLCKVELTIEPIDSYN